MGKILTAINKVSFWVCLTATIGLFVASFLVPPMGVIDASVLKAGGMLFLFATLGTVIVAIERGSDISLKHGDLEVKVENENEEGED